MNTDHKIAKLNDKINANRRGMEILDDMIGNGISPEEYYSDLEEENLKIEEEIQTYKKNKWKIFYPDPVNEDDCAQCGKHRSEHSESPYSRFVIDGQRRGAFFCNK